MSADRLADDLTALAGIYRKQAEQSPSEFARWAYKTVRAALDRIENNGKRPMLYRLCYGKRLAWWKAWRRGRG